MNLTELSKKIHQNAVNKGFWDKELSDEHCLMLVICELAEAIEADRKGNRADVYAMTESIEAGGFASGFFEEYIKDTVEDELADAVIRLLDLAGARGIEMKELYFDYGESTLIREIYYMTSLLSMRGTYIGYKINHVINMIKAYCENNNIDLMWHIEQKMKYNEHRERMHGKRY